VRVRLSKKPADSQNSPDAAREATVLFKTVQTMLPEDAYRELGEQFEETEHETFGDKGFQKIIEAVEAAEAQLAIGNLAQFTPAM
jgi:hypothetical protein